MSINLERRVSQHHTDCESRAQRRFAISFSKMLSALSWLTVAVSLPGAFAADYSVAARAVQFDVRPLLNARAVTTLANGKLVTWNKGIDGAWSGLATRQAADAMGSKDRIALPDDGVFPANQFHPRTVLRFANSDATGNQVHFSEKGVADTYSFPVPEDYYSNLFLFFMSAFGTSDVSVEIAYGDKTVEVKKFSVEDWATRLPENESKFCLSAGLAKWGTANTEMEPDGHYLMGLNLKPVASKKVVQVTVNKPAADTTLTFWGATGYRNQTALRTVTGSAPEISYEGRAVVASDGTVRLGYSGIIARVNFRGSTLNLRARTTSDELYLDVRIDDGAPSFLKVPKGEGEVALAAGLRTGEHRVEILKRVESCVGVLEVVSLSVDGEFLAPTPLPARRLMFLGDSFTAGQATTVEDGGPMDPSKAMRENARLSYGRLLADRLHAQCHIIAYAGRGVVRDWQGLSTVRCAPEYYEYALPDDPATPWNPQQYVPDAIGVCLGNNDFDTGVPDQTQYLSAYCEFLRKLRRDAPQAPIFLITAPSLADEPGQVPLRTVQIAYFAEIVRRLGDPKIQVVNIPHYPGVPGDWHPSGTAHRAIADELEPVFRKTLKW